MKYIWYAILMAVLGCSSEKDFHPAYDVPEDFRPFIESFIKEAADRGHTYVITNLIIKYDENLTSPYCGQCNSNSLDANVQKLITINPNMTCWYSPEEQEAFFFHELGHCILGRLHDNSLLPNGDFKSMMVTNDLSIYSSCIYDTGAEDCNKLYKRPYYLDELFDEGSPVPAWAK